MQASKQAEASGGGNVDPVPVVGCRLRINTLPISNRFRVRIKDIYHMQSRALHSERYASDVGCDRLVIATKLLDFKSRLCSLRDKQGIKVYPHVHTHTHQDKIVSLQITLLALQAPRMRQILGQTLELILNALDRPVRIVHLFFDPLLQLLVRHVS